MKPLLTILLTGAILGAGWNLLLAQPAPVLPKPHWLGKSIDQGDSDPRLKGYFTPEGLKVEIVADFPTVVNPVGMTFGTDGALCVLELAPTKAAAVKQSVLEFEYRDGSKRKVAVLTKPAKDAVKVLIAKKDDDGIYDQAKVIHHDEFPAGILRHDGYLYVAGQGTVRRYMQLKPDGSLGKAEVIAHGFGSGQQPAGGLTLGIDGWLYITSGPGDHFVEGADGSRADVLHTGAVFRCQPDGSKMHLFALGLGKTRGGGAFDAIGNLYHADSKAGTGTKWTLGRLLHVAEDADFGWRSGALHEQPGALAPLHKLGTSASVLIYEDTFLPGQFRGLVYWADPHAHAIRAGQLDRKGATFAVTHEFDLLRSDDPLFQPQQLVVGPDGAIYVCDRRCAPDQPWGDGKQGRIYRISWSGTKEQPALKLRALDSWARISQQSDAELLKTLASENFTDRQQAQHELVRRGDKNRKPLLKLLEDDEQFTVARSAALGTLQSMWNKEVSTVCQKLLAHPDSDLRRLAANALAAHAVKGDKIAHQNLVQALSDEDPAAKRALVLAIGKIGAAGAGDTLANALKFDNGKDPYLRDGIIRSIERVGKPGIDSLLALANSGVDTDLDRVVLTFATLRAPAAADALPELLKNVHLSNKQKTLLIKSYQNYHIDPPVSLEPVALHLDDLVQLAAKPNLTDKEKTKLAQAQPVKLACLQVLASDKKLASEKAKQVILDLLAHETDGPVRLAALKVVMDTRLNRAGPILVKTLTMMGEPRPAGERAAIIKALGALKTTSAAPVLESLLAGKTPADADEQYVRAEALRALAAIVPETGFKTAKSLLANDEPEVQKAAIGVLGVTPAGAKLVAEQFLKTKLPREFGPQVINALSPHAESNPELARLLAEVIKSVKTGKSP